MAIYWVPYEIPQNLITQVFQDELHVTKRISYLVDLDLSSLVHMLGNSNLFLYVWFWKLLSASSAV